MTPNSVGRVNTRRLNMSSAGVTKRVSQNMSRAYRHSNNVLSRQNNQSYQAADEYGGDISITAGTP